MTYSLRSIAFVAELIHPPVKHEPRQLQKLHGEIFESAESPYRDFRLVAGGAQLSNAQPGLPGSPVSLANILADRVQVREEQTGCSREDFEARLSRLGAQVLSNLPVNLFMVQQFAIRSVINPISSTDARAFVLETMLGFDGTLLSAFPAQPSLGALPFTFPPSGEGQAVYNVRIESYSQDNRSVFLENVGTFGRPVTASGLDQLVGRFGETYQFMNEHLMTFVAQFDGEEP